MNNLIKQGKIVIGQAVENQRRLDTKRYRCEFKRNLGSREFYIWGDRQMLSEELVSHR